MCLLMAKKCQKEIYCINRQSDFFAERKEKKNRNAKNRFNNIKFKLR